MKRHRTDFVSLIFGALFAAIGVAMLTEGLELGQINVAELWPGLLILIGLAILLAARGGSREVAVVDKNMPLGADPSSSSEPAAGTAVTKPIQATSPDEPVKMAETDVLPPSRASQQGGDPPD